MVSSMRIANTSEANKTKQKSATVHIPSPNDSKAASSDDDSDHINTDKLKTIRNKAAQRYDNDCLAYEIQTRHIVIPV